MSTELEDIILTIDVHEEANKKEKTRIAAVKGYVESHGCENVFFKELKHGDYEIIGHFRDVPVNVIIEYKAWDNFLSDDIAEMEEKLLLATEEYDHVGFFVETQNYTFTPDENNSHGKLNYSIPRLNKNLPAKTLASMEGMFDTISKHPQIHVRQLRSEAQFPYSLYDLLVYLQSEHGMTRNRYLNKNIFLAWYKSLLAAIPSLKSESTRNGTMTKKRIEKVIEHYPNLFWLCSASEESLIEVMGKQIGMTIYTVLHYDGLITPEWRAGHHLDGTDKYKTICGQDCYNPQHCSALCERHPNNPLLKKQDNEGRLAFDAPAKNPIISEKAQKGVVIMTNHAINCMECQTKFDAIITHSKCDYADPKKRAECKTPDHFKNPSHVPERISKTILPSVRPGTDTLQSLSTDVCGKTPRQAESIDAPKSVSPKGTQDTSSHPEAASFEHTTLGSASGDKTLGVPPIVSTNDGSGDTSYLDEKTKCIVKCRSCLQPISPEQDDDTGLCHDPKCIAERDKPKYKLSCLHEMNEFFADGKQHSLSEFIDTHSWSPDTVFNHAMNATRDSKASEVIGLLKKITEQDGRVITFQRIT